MITEEQRLIILKALRDSYANLTAKNMTEKEFDNLINAMTIAKTCSIPDVSKALPTEECVEQWWAEGQDQKNGFWEEAPYRTNGDVIEEIKTALKYFIETWQR